MIPNEIRITEHKEETIFEMKKEYPYIIRKIVVPFDGFLSVPWHWHPELELLILKEGHIEYLSTDKKVSLNPGDGMFINSNVLHTVQFIAPTSFIRYDVHMFQKEFIVNSNSLLETKYILPLLECNGITLLPLRQSDPVHSHILKELCRLTELESEGGFGYELHSRNIVSEIMLALYENQKETICGKQRFSWRNETSLKSMLLFIQEHYMEALTLDDIAESAHIGRRECLRRFQKNLQITPFEYLRSYRIQAACGLLCYTSDSILDIAMKTGFSSGSYFGKIFRENMYCTPNEYRKKLSEHG